MEVQSQPYHQPKLPQYHHHAYNGKIIPRKVVPDLILRHHVQSTACTWNDWCSGLHRLMREGQSNYRVLRKNTNSHMLIQPSQNAWFAAAENWRHICTSYTDQRHQTGGSYRDSVIFQILFRSSMIQSLRTIENFVSVNYTRLSPSRDLGCFLGSKSRNKKVSVDHWMRDAGRQPLEAGHLSLLGKWGWVARFNGANQIWTFSAGSETYKYLIFGFCRWRALIPCKH